MRFTSLNKKLGRLTTTILILAIGLFFFLVTVIGFLLVQQSRKTSEHFIENSLMAKGRILIKYSTRLIEDLASENAISSIRNMIQSIIEDDPDVVYGIFMDINNRPWALLGHTDVLPGTFSGSMNDSMSIWAGNVKNEDIKIITTGTDDVIEFAAPVIAGEIRLGTVRYGISRAVVTKALRDAEKDFYFNTALFLSLLISVGILIYLIVSRLAFSQAKSIISPIESLTHIAHAIAHGNYEQRVISQSDDEIGALADAFEQMRTTIKDYTANLENKVTKRTRELEYAHNELATTYDKLLGSEKMKELLTNTLVHDIKNVVFTMAGDIQTTLKNTTHQLTSKGQRKIDKIQRSCYEIFRLTMNILDVSRIEDNKLPVNLEKIECNTFCDLVSSAIERSRIENHAMKVSIEMPENKFTITADRHLLERVFMNLASNAAKYGKRSGDVKVSFRTGSGTCFITFYNSGTPIVPERLEQIFEKFYTDSEKHSAYSKGIGLYFCRTVLEAMNGQITGEALEKGNQFIIELPTI